MTYLVTHLTTGLGMFIKSLELKGYKRLMLNNIDYIKITPHNHIQLILGTNGSGKAQPLTAPIKIPGGWSTMGDMRIGTEVIAKDGSTSKVLTVHPQGLQDIYRITFADGRNTEATSDHLWKLYVGECKHPVVPSIVTTSDIVSLSNSYVKDLLWIDLCDSEQSLDIDLPVDPYVLGVMLGDGCMHKMNRLIGDKLNTDVTYSITNYLKECGLYNKRFIPELYLNGSTQQRLALLQGLLDSDGTVGKFATVSFCSSSKALSKGVEYLVRSLGGIASISTRDSHYQVNIRYKTPEDLFTLPKKQLRCNNNQHSPSLKLKITNIEKIGVKEAQCITIDHPEHLYITNDFVVTHNSSLLSELTPLPALPASYFKEGYKIVSISHMGSEYLLSSTFSSGNRFSFLKDEVELNPGGTAAVYKELVRKEFNITTDIHDIMSGVQKFHRMSIAERRSWFTKISECDYTYAIKYYQKLKEQLRDLQGAIKLNQARLVQETNRLLNPEDEAIYRTNIAELHVLVNMLLDYKIPSTSSARSLHDQLQSLDSVINTLATGLITARRQFTNDEQYTCIDDIDLAIISLQSDISSLNRYVVTLCTDIESLQSSLKVMNELNLDSISSVDETINELTVQISHLSGQIRHPLQFKELMTTLQAINTVQPMLTSILTTMPSNPSINGQRRYSREYYQGLLLDRQEIVAATAEIDVLQIKAIHRRSELEHLRDHNQTECPKCRHTWSVGYDLNSYNKILAVIENNASKLDTLKTRLDVSDELINAAKDYLELFKGYREITRAWDSLQPLWQYIVESDLLFSNPRQILNRLEQVKDDVLVMIRIAELQTRLNSSLELKQLVTANQATNRVNLSADMERLNNELVNCNSLIQSKQTYVQQLTGYRNIGKRIQQQSIELEQHLATRSNHVESLEQLLKQDALNDTIQIVRLRISEQEQLISRIDLQRALIANLESQIQDQTDRVAVLKLVIRQLSPDDGLIAKGLTGFINSFINQVNTFIRKIWLYPLELQHVTTSDDDSVELDYRFAIRVNDNIEIPDISKGSSAMKEIVDLAFVIVSMGYLGLHQAPLYIDELGASLDHSHRQAAFYAITNLLTADTFSQIFLISHYDNSYGSLKNADVTVLSASNIILPKDLEFNKHVVIQ